MFCDRGVCLHYTRDIVKSGGFTRSGCLRGPTTILQMACDTCSKVSHDFICLFVCGIAQSFLDGGTCFSNKVLAETMLTLEKSQLVKALRTIC